MITDRKRGLNGQRHAEGDHRITLVYCASVAVIDRGGGGGEGGKKRDIQRLCFKFDVGRTSPMIISPWSGRMRQ